MVAVLKLKEAVEEAALVVDEEWIVVERVTLASQIDSSSHHSIRITSDGIQRSRRCRHKPNNKVASQRIAR